MKWSRLITWAEREREIGDTHIERKKERKWNRLIRRQKGSDWSSDKRGREQWKKSRKEWILLF